MWLKNAEPPLNPPPEINVEGFNIFFRLSARSSNTRQRGLIWSAIFTPLNFAAHRTEAPNFIFVRNDTFQSLLTSRKLVSIAVQ